MPRIRFGRFQAHALVATALLALSSGCVRHSMTRVFLKGDVVNERGARIPHTVVRIDNDRETITDERGQYRFLFLAQCLRPGIGGSGVTNNTLSAFADGYVPAHVGFHLDTAELIGSAGCQTDVEKFLRVTLVSE